MYSALRLVPQHRPGYRLPSGGGVTERWAWDFEIDGQSLNARVPGDVVGALGWGTPEWEAGVVATLRGAAAPDLPPDRVALYRCAECGDLGCGAVTAALERTPEAVIWRELRFENDYDPAQTRELAVGPFRFAPAAYDALLTRAISHKPGPGAAPLAAG